MCVLAHLLIKLLNQIVCNRKVGDQTISYNSFQKLPTDNVYLTKTHVHTKDELNIMVQRVINIFIILLVNG